MRLTLQNGIYTIRTRDYETRRTNLEDALRVHFERSTDRGFPPDSAFFLAAEVLAPMIIEQGHGTIHEGVATG